MNEKNLVTAAVLSLGAGLAAASPAEAQAGADICYNIDHGAGVGDNDNTIVHCGMLYSMNATTTDYVNLAEKLLTYVYNNGQNDAGNGNHFVFDTTIAAGDGGEYTCNNYNVVSAGNLLVGSAQSCTYTGS